MPEMPRAPAATQHDKRLLSGPKKKPVRKQLPAIVELAIAVAASLLICRFAWSAASSPSRFLNTLINRSGFIDVYSWCSGLEAGSPAMFIGSSLVGLASLAVGPLLVIGGMFLFRRSLAKIIGRGIQLLPRRLSFLGSPVIATLLFLVGWAGVHFDTANKTGIVPHRIFPVFVAVFAFTTTKYGPRMQQRFSGFFRLRDMFPMKLRLIAAIAAPFLLGALLSIAGQDNAGRIENPAPREQFIVLVSLMVGYLALVPRRGDIVDHAEKWLGPTPPQPPPIPR